jgi:hypothetical protein
VWPYSTAALSIDYPKTPANAAYTPKPAVRSIDASDQAGIGALKTVTLRQRAGRKCEQEAERDRQQGRIQHLDADAEGDEVRPRRDQRSPEYETRREQAVEPRRLAWMVGKRAAITGNFADAPCRGFVTVTSVGRGGECGQSDLMLRRRRLAIALPLRL